MLKGGPRGCGRSPRLGYPRRPGHRRRAGVTGPRALRPRPAEVLVAGPGCRGCHRRGWHRTWTAGASGRGPGFCPRHRDGGVRVPSPGGCSPTWTGVHEQAGAPRIDHRAGLRPFRAPGPFDWYGLPAGSARDSGGSLSDLATWMITAALAAIGLSTRFSHIRRAGPRPILLGAILWATVGVTSLVLQAATGTI